MPKNFRDLRLLFMNWFLTTFLLFRALLFLAFVFFFCTAHYSLIISLYFPIFFLLKKRPSLVYFWPVFFVSFPIDSRHHFVILSSSFDSFSRLFRPVDVLIFLVCSSSFEWIDFFLQRSLLLGVSQDFCWRQSARVTSGVQAVL